MPDQSKISVKDSALTDSITSLRKKLSDAHINIVEQSWKNPIDKRWHSKVNDRDYPLLFAAGKASSKNESLANAFHEFIKYLSSHYFWADLYLGDGIANNNILHSSKEKWFDTQANGSWPKNILNEELCQFYNPLGQLNTSNLIDVTSSNEERGICCLPYEDIQTGELIYFPVNLIDNLYNSNGLALGHGTDPARINALLEILEHYVQFKVIAEGISLPKIPDSILNNYPDALESISKIVIKGYELSIHDSSLANKYPVIAVTVLNPKNHNIHVSFGANLNFEKALERCFNQLFNNTDFEDFAEAGFDMDEIASPQNLENHFQDSKGIVAWKFLNENTDYNFVDWSHKYSNFSADESYKQLCHIIQSEGNTIFINDFNFLDYNICRVIVPGMSEIYPVDDLIWENNNAGIKVREQILKKNKSIKECEMLIENLEELNLDDEYLVSKLIALPADKESIFSDLCITELILLLALKVQDNERIQESCEWLLHFKKINPHRLKTYQCINTILQLDKMTDYGIALEKLYSQEILNNALALIDGEDIFPLESEWKTHDSLIDAYKKIINLN